MNARREFATYVAIVLIFGFYSVGWLAPRFGWKPFVMGGHGEAEALLFGMMALGFFVARRLTR